MLEFNKYSNNRYNVTAGVGALDTAIKETINDISVIKIKSFNSSMNNSLYETILSRYVAGLFIQKYPEVSSKEHHIIVTIDINGKTYNITLGNFSIEQEFGYIHGVTEV